MIDLFPAPQDIMSSLRTVMRAVRMHAVGGPEVLQLDSQVPIPQPKSGELLVKVKAAGVNPSDTYMRAGIFGRNPTAFPIILGQDAAGIVEKLGPDVTGFKVGDRVFCAPVPGSPNGAYAEYMVASAFKTFPLPERLSFSQGAALGVPYFTAMRALKKAKVQAGETVLIQGASGGVGLAACQLAAAMNLKVIGTAGTDHGSELVLKSGASKVLNHRDPNHLQNLKDANGGKGFDIILEMLANVNLGIDFEIIGKNGRIVIIGSRGKIEVDPRGLMRTEASCTGVMLYEMTPSDWQDYGRVIVEYIEKGLIIPVIDQEFSLEQASEAHKAVIEHSSGAKGKIILSVAESE